MRTLHTLLEPNLLGLLSMYLHVHVHVGHSAMNISIRNMFNENNYIYVIEKKKIRKKKKITFLTRDSLKVLE